MNGSTSGLFNAELFAGNHKKLARHIRQLRIMNLKPNLKHALNYIVEGVNLLLLSQIQWIFVFKSSNESLDYDGLAAEHLLLHTSFSFIIAKLFNLVFKAGYVPKGFGRGLSIPTEQFQLRLMILDTLLSSPLFLSSLNIVFCP